MTPLNFRCYPRNSPQAAGRILATALLANGDVKALSQISGVGKKTAERLVMELKGKVVNVERGKKNQESDVLVEVIEGL